MPLFIRGIPGKSGQKSTFTQEAIGTNTMSKTPSWIAEWLRLESPERYSLTSFKRLLTRNEISDDFGSGEQVAHEENSDPILVDPVYIKTERNSSSLEYVIWHEI